MILSESPQTLRKTHYMESVWLWYFSAARLDAIKVRTMIIKWKQLLHLPLLDERELVSTEGHS